MQWMLTVLHVLFGMSHLVTAAYHYEMTEGQRGICIIINNYRFDPTTGNPDRLGTYADSTSMYWMMQAMGFVVRQFNDVSKGDLFMVLQRAALEDHSEYDAFAVVILSHGEDPELIWMTDGMVRVKTILSFFTTVKCPTLAGKPKLFFLAACRGDYYDDGVKITRNKRSDPLANIPPEPDFLIAYSVPAGYSSWRHNERGTWFIQALYNVLGNFGFSMDLLTMLTRAAYVVATEHASHNSNPAKDGKVQVPQIVSTLVKDLHFPKFPYQQPKTT